MVGAGAATAVVLAVVVGVLAGATSGEPYFVRLCHGDTSVTGALEVYVDGVVVSGVSVSAGTVSEYVEVASAGSHAVGWGLAGSGVEGGRLANVSVSGDGKVRFFTVVKIHPAYNGSMVLPDDGVAPAPGFATIRFVNLAAPGASAQTLRVQKVVPLVNVTGMEALPAFVAGASVTEVGNEAAFVRGVVRVNETTFSLYRPALSSPPDATVGPIALGSRAGITGIYRPDKSFLTLQGEFVSGRQFEQLVDLTGGRVDRALLMTGSIVVTVTAPTLVTDTVTLTARSHLVVSSALTVAASLTLADSAVISVADVALIVNTLTLPRGTVLAFRISSLTPIPVVVRGQATLGGNIRLVIPASFTFRKDTQYTVMRCSPCVGSIVNATVSLVASRAAHARAPLQSLVVSETAALVRCSATSCVVTAGNGLPPAVRPFTNDTNTDKVVIAIFLFTLAFLLMLAFCIRKWWLIRSERRPDPSKYYEVNKHLRDFEPTRRAIKQNYAANDEEHSVAFADASVASADEFDSADVDSEYVSTGSPSSSGYSSSSAAYSDDSDSDFRRRF